MTSNFLPRHHTSARLFTATALLAIAIIAILQGPSSVHASAVTRNFACTQSPEYFTVPADVYSISFDMNGAADGWGSGRGASVTGTVTVTPGEELEIKVGCQGIKDISSSGAGGYPDGGDGAGFITGVSGAISASGGGGSSSIVADYALSYEVLAIAGGGGGGTNFNPGGSAGIDGGDAVDGYGGKEFMNGKGATQFAGGSERCNLANYCSGAGSYLKGGSNPFGGGGGGGYYGGGAGTGAIYAWFDTSYTDYSTSGGAGSSYVSPTRSQGLTSPQYSTSDWGIFRGTYDGTIAISWIPTPTTTLAPTTTIASTTTAVSPTTTLATTTTLPPTTFTTVALTPPSWSSTPEVESELPVIASTPFPLSGVGTMEVTNETGFIVTKSRSLIPKWRTRVYIGDFKFSLKATYIVSKKKKTFTCRFPTFGTQKIQKTLAWRWYQPSKGCVLPKDLVTQLSKRQTTMSLIGTFTRKWATTGKRLRPDGSKITIRKISLRIGATKTVTLS